MILNFTIDDDGCFEGIDRSGWHSLQFTIVVDIRWWMTIPTQPHSTRRTDSQGAICSDPGWVGYCNCWWDDEGGHGFVKSCLTPLSTRDKGRGSYWPLKRMWVWGWKCGRSMCTISISKASRIAHCRQPSPPWSISRSFQRYSLLNLAVDAIKYSRNPV